MWTAPPLYPNTWPYLSPTWGPSCALAWGFRLRVCISVLSSVLDVLTETGESHSLTVKLLLLSSVWQIEIGEITSFIDFTKVKEKTHSLAVELRENILWTKQEWVATFCLGQQAMKEKNHSKTTLVV